MKTQKDFNEDWPDVLDWARKKLTEIAAELTIYEPDHGLLQRRLVEAELDRLDETVKQTLHSLVDEVCVGWRAEYASAREAATVTGPCGPLSRLPPSRSPE